jgi:hypothetical protein
MTAKKRPTSKAKPRSGTAAKRPVGRRAQNKEAIRKRIVTAALSLFQTKGFDATTTKAIARKAGIAEGTVFNYSRPKKTSHSISSSWKLTRQSQRYEATHAFGRRLSRRNFSRSFTASWSFWPHTSDSSALLLFMR